MKSIYFKYILAAFTGCCLLGISCSKFTEVKSPVNQLSADVVFTSDATATSSIAGLYAQIVQNNEMFLNGFFSVYAGLSADEFTNTQTNANADPFVNNALVATTALLENNAWIKAYNYIYQANLCIEGLQKSTGVSQLVQKQLLGEAKFLRALNYFYLVNAFGDVPLQITSDYRLNANYSRTISTDVYVQIIADLRDAQSLLVPAYPTSNGAPVRANKWAATALLARAYLYTQNWAGADSAATAVIGSGNYNLVTDLTKVFLAGSKEAILQFIPAPGSFNSSEGNSFIPQNATVNPNYTLTTIQLNSFETGDTRKTNWLATKLSGTTTYTYPYKYRVGFTSGTATITENSMVLRYAEQLLIRAEARAQQNNLTGAASDLNAVRTRAGATLLPIVPTTQAAMLIAVLHERQVELFAEWGHRWFDLKRTGQVNTALAYKVGWKATSALYPIPYAELQLNPFLTQNVGY